jgi:toxin-antitoxin system PIN domain toxin
VNAWFDNVPPTERIYFCRSTQQSFLRLLTNASIVAPYGETPRSNEAAWADYDRVLADTRVSYLTEEPAGIDRWWRRYSERNTASPKLWMDAYLAAFARAEGCTLVTTDGAFKQFDGLDYLILG